jgi:hypothetical protein
MHVVTNDGPILGKVAQSQEQVLREVGYRNYKKCARAIDHPGVVRLDIGHFRRHPKPTVAQLFDPRFDAVDCGFEVKRTARRPVRAGWSITIVEQIDAFVIRKESVAGVKTAADGNVRPPAAPE